MSSLEAMDDVIVRDPYHFVKPKFARMLFARVVGEVKMLLAEGDEHKVSCSDW